MLGIDRLIVVRDLITTIFFSFEVNAEVFCLGSKMFDDDILFRVRSCNSNIVHSTPSLSTGRHVI